MKVLGISIIVNSEKCAKTCSDKSLNDFSCSFSLERIENIFILDLARLSYFYFYLGFATGILIGLFYSLFFSSPYSSCSRCALTSCPVESFCFNTENNFKTMQILVLILVIKVKSKLYRPLFSNVHYNEYSLHCRAVQTVGPGPKFGTLTDFFWAL